MSCDSEERRGDEEEEDDAQDIMDEHMAAMVLTSLSASPMSPPPIFNYPSNGNGFSDKGIITFT